MNFLSMHCKLKLKDGGLPSIGTYRRKGFFRSSLASKNSLRKVITPTEYLRSKDFEIKNRLSTVICGRFTKTTISLELYVGHTHVKPHLKAQIFV